MHITHALVTSLLKLMHFCAKAPLEKNDSSDYKVRKGTVQWHRDESRRLKTPGNGARNYERYSQRVFGALMNVSLTYEHGNAHISPQELRRFAIANYECGKKQKIFNK